MLMVSLQAVCHSLFKTQVQPQPGTVAILTKTAIVASFSFISLELMASEIEAEEIATVLSGLLSYLEGLGIRVAEGIALPLIICKKIRQKHRQ
uniref:Uncharacterized protein n=1 Tax=Magallana gigas TaxID=29159 RepID=A0A8W8MLU1_MAGGI